MSATKKQLKEFIIKLRKMQRNLEKQETFCREHNFHLEKEVFSQKAKLVGTITHDMENHFDLGFVWDNSLND